MRPSLGQILIQHGLVTREELEVALKAQAIWGGRLGTNLVEAGVLDLEALSDALAKHLGLPAAKEQHFKAASAEAIAKVPAKIAEKHQAVPLGFVTKPARMLVVAFANPTQYAAVDEVAFVAGMRVYPLVAPELRILAALEQHYGIPRKTRYLRVVGMERPAQAAPAPVSQAAPRPKFLDPNAGHAAAPTPAAAPTQEESEWLSGPDPVEWSRPVAGASALPVAQPGAAPSSVEPPMLDLGLADVVEEGPRVESRPVPASLPTPEPPPSSVARPALGASEAAARIAQADKRDQIGDALVDYLRSVFGYGLLFMVRDETALGWKGFAPNVEADSLEAASVPLRPASVLRLVHERKTLFRGAPPADGASLHSRLWKLLRSAAPSEVIVAPVIINDRVVSLVYAHLADGGVLPDAVLADMMLVCSSAASGFVRLIQNAKARV